MAQFPRGAVEEPVELRHTAGEQWETPIPSPPPMPIPSAPSGPPDPPLHLSWGDEMMRDIRADLAAMKAEQERVNEGLLANLWTVAVVLKSIRDEQARTEIQVTRIESVAAPEGRVRGALAKGEVRGALYGFGVLCAILAQVLSHVFLGR